MIIDTRYFNRTEPTLDMIHTCGRRDHWLCLVMLELQKYEPIEDEA